jgi:hypothetical protein
MGPGHSPRCVRIATWKLNFAQSSTQYLSSWSLREPTETFSMQIRRAVFLRR